jgi:pimeloyl-ACP methyl ester carboxylesterase
MTTVETCANQIGARRTAYATADSVLDLDAIREALYAPRMALMGISYGTFVATQYARRFPDKVDWMVLDSVVGARGIDPYLLDSFTRVPRIVREQCARDRCRGATRDAYADLEQLVARVRRGPVRGWRWDERGRRVPTAVRDEGELFLMVLGADLNPYLQAALPGAIRAALAGDTELLARLRRLSDGGPTPVADLSAGLNVATICGDVPLPYTFTDPVGTRWDRWQHAIDAVPDAAFTPFSRKTVLDVSLAHDCLRWPEGDVFAAPSEAPLPDVPALLYSGRLDFRTPLENARAVQATLPRAELVGVAGTGHDVLDSDITGCAATALRRFARRRPVGTPCAGRTNIVEPFPTPPRRLRDFRPAPGVRGDRGRIVFGVLDTVVDARVTALQTLYAGFDPVRGGGLRGGTFSASIDEGRFDLRRYQYLDGLRVTGRLLAEGENDVRGRVRVDGPGRLDGWLRLDRRGGVRGRIGGRAVRYRPGASASAAAAGARPRLAGRPLPSLRAAAARLARRLP